MRIQIDIPDELGMWLQAAAVETGISPQQLAEEALLGYLEDREDYQVALEGRKSAAVEGTVPLEEVMRRLGLEN